MSERDREKNRSRKIQKGRRISRQREKERGRKRMEKIRKGKKEKEQLFVRNT